MSKQLAYLEYLIMFDPAETWSHLFEFENKFGEFLGTLGLEAEISVSIGMATKRVLVIKKKEEILPVAPPVISQRGPQEALREVKKGLR